MPTVAAVVLISHIWRFADMEVIALFLAIVTLFLIVKGESHGNR
jgi:hypothetical protein